MKAAADIISSPNKHNELIQKHEVFPKKKLLHNLLLFRRYKKHTTLL